MTEQMQNKEHPHPWTFLCLTFGCKVNQYETQAVREAWSLAGGREVETPSDANLILVNSCAITGRAERDARNCLIRLRHEAPHALLVLTGCAARLVADFVPRADAPRPEADSIVVQEQKQDLLRPSVLEGLLETAWGLFPIGTISRAVSPINCKSLLNRPWPAMQITEFRRARPVLKVQDGCSHRCTYCIVPQTRGPHVSRHPDEVVAEAARLWQDHAEIMVSGVNLGQYGRDHPEYGTFWELLKYLEDQLGERFAARRRLRISSLEPSQLDEAGCRILTESALTAPHLHISLQHASSAVLKRMGRGHYKASTLTDALARLQDHWPVMGLGADILVGFPGESTKDVDELCRFIEETPFTYAHVFPYSRRPGTPAASFAEQLPRKEKQARAKAVREAVAEKMHAFWQSQLQVPSFKLVLDASEGSLPGYVHGVNEYYAPCYLPSALQAGLPEGLGQRDYIEVRPTGICERGIVVEPL